MLFTATYELYLFYRCHTLSDLDIFHIFFLVLNSDFSYLFDSQFIDLQICANTSFQLSLMVGCV